MAACAHALPESDDTDSSVPSDATASKDSPSASDASSCPQGCEAGLVCSNGACKSTCDSPQIECSGEGGAVCATTSSDPKHCGNCTTTCTTADAGAMVPGTDNPDPLIFDGGYDGGFGWTLGVAACSNSQCGVDCPDASTLCPDEICYDTENHHDHCGSCTTACAQTTEWCTDGHCCGIGNAWCTSACASILTDTNNCGSCGHVCDGGSCSGGACAACVTSTVTTAPTLTMAINGWPNAGLRLTALKNTTLTSFVVHNQGAADTINLTTTTGTILQTIALPANNTTFTANVAWALTQGTSYDLVLVGGVNGMWNNFSSFPQSSTGIEVVDTVDTSQTLQPAYWFTFTNLASCP